MKRKWYLQTWFICLLIFFWFLFIPGFIGFILLVVQIYQDYKFKEQYGNAFNEILNNPPEKEKRKKANLDTFLYNIFHVKKPNEIELAKNLESVKNENIELYEDFETLTNKYSELEGENYGLNEKLNLLQNKKAELSSNLETLLNENKHLKVKNCELEKENETLQKTCIEYDSYRESCEEQLSPLNSELAHYKEQLNEYKKMYDDLCHQYIYIPSSLTFIASNLGDYTKTIEQQIELYDLYLSDSSLDELYIDSSCYAIRKESIAYKRIAQRYKIDERRARKIFNQLIITGVINEDGKALFNLSQFSNQIRYGAITLKYQNNLNKTVSIDFFDYDAMTGNEFEFFCADILRKNNFQNVEVTQESGDNGIDILAEKDNITYAIQCKCYSSNIGNKAVQEAYSGVQMYKTDVGVVLTNRYFTDSAIRTAKETKIKLWDRDKLISLIDNAKR